MSIHICATLIGECMCDGCQKGNRQREREGLILSSIHIHLRYVHSMDGINAIQSVRFWFHPTLRRHLAT